MPEWRKARDTIRAHDVTEHVEFFSGVGGSLRDEPRELKP